VTNPAGHPETLVAAHPGNANRLVHGLYAEQRDVSPKARAIAEELLTLPWAAESDWPAALEIGKLEVLIDRVDKALEDGRVEKGDAVRALVDQRRRLSAQLERWYSLFGLAPETRSRWAARLAAGGGTFADAVERRLREIQPEGR
jgi:hypothetical protein